MRTFPLIVVFVCFCCFFTEAGAQTVVGSGPDPACGGTELRITQLHGQVSCVEQTLFASNRTVVERYRPLPGGDWKVTLLLYSSRWQNNELPTRKRLVRSVSFRASEAAIVAPRYKKSFGYGDLNWSAEPKRLLVLRRADFAGCLS